MNKIQPYILLILVVFNSCSKDSENTGNRRPLADFNYTDEIYRFRLSSESTDPDDDTLTYKWTANTDSVKIINYTNQVAYFNIPPLAEPVSIDITLTVSDGFDQDSVVKSIILPATGTIREWGLGKELQEETKNNTDYEWYIDQMNTGIYSNNNCGPTAVTMAIKWANESFNKTPEDARNTYRPQGGWWYTDDIINYLNLYSINNKTINLSDADKLIHELNDGNIVIICLDMYFISNELSSEWRINKFYPTANKDWGHFILLKGYKIVDGNIWFEFYDPNSWGKRYNDNSLKGKDRYYSDKDINVATNQWWDFAIVVSRNEFKTADGIDYRFIPHRYGR